MPWYQRIFIGILVTSLMVPYQSAARTMEKFSAEERARLSEYKNYLEPMGYEVFVDKTKDQANVIDKKTKKLVMEIPFSSGEKVRRYSPKNLNQQLLNEMIKVKQSGKAAWSHSVRNLPMESAVFFMAMGALVAGQLVMDYSQNPLAMEQHIQHQLSPMGVASFFAFMYSQGLTSNVLSLYVSNPKFHHLIPYLGMTVGFFVQSYLSSVASDPNVKACVKSLLGSAPTAKAQKNGVSAEPCEAAYDSLVSKKKLWELAPGLVSMLASTALAGVGQAVVTKAVLRVTGVDLALWLMPGTAQLKGMRLFLVKGLQMGAFVGIDMWMNRKVTYAWKNFFDGRDLERVNQGLVAEIVQAKSSHWSGNLGNLHTHLKTLQRSAGDWRMMNMAEVYEAHQSWSDHLQQLTGMYNASYGFYGAMAREIRAARGGQASQLDRIHPLFGVKAKGLAAGKEDLYFTHPQFVSPMQIETIQDTVAEATERIKQKHSNYNLMSPFEKKTFREVLNFLASEEPQQIGEGLKEIRRQLYSVGLSPSALSSYFRQELIQIYRDLGEPTPLLEPGQGFVEGYGRISSHSEALAGLKFSHRAGPFKVEKATDYFVTQMLCGPQAHKGNSLIQQTMGFAAKFTPPAIVDENAGLNVICQSTGNGVDIGRLYSWPLRSEGDSQIYRGGLEFLRVKALDKIVGKDVNEFQQWWKQSSEAQMQKSFTQYGQQYQQIVAKMMGQLNRVGSSSINAGPLSNGVLVALFQEARLYNMILGELLKDTHLLQHKAPLSKEYFDEKQEPSVRFSAHEQGLSEIPLLNLFARSTEPVLEWSRLVQPWAKASPLLKGATSPMGYRLKIQTEVDQGLAQMNGLIQSIKIQGQGDSVRVESSLENYQLEEQNQKLQASLSRFAQLLGVGEEGAESLVTLTPQQREVALQCLEALQGLSTEMMMFGTIANAVDWDKIQGVQRLNVEQQQFNNRVQEVLGKMRGMANPTP